MDAVKIPGGTAFVGTDTPFIPEDGEAPLKTVRIKPFQIGATAVTNAQFHDFVAATDYVTEAERFGWSFVFWAQVPDPLKPTSGVVGAEWWRQVEGANWRDKRWSTQSARRVEKSPSCIFLKRSRVSFA